MDRNRQLEQVLLAGCLLVAGLGVVGGQAWAVAGLCLWFVIVLGVWIAGVSALEQLAARSEGLPEREVLRNALGLAVQVRARVAGCPVLLNRRGAEVELTGTPHDLTYDAATLAALRKADAPLAGAAQVLSAAGVQRLIVEDRRLRLVGGRGPLAPLVEAALTLAGVERRVSLAATSPGHCPYCHQPASFREEAVQRCSACDALHHNACWQEHGGCAVFGCERGPQRDRPAARAAVDPKGRA